MTDNRRSPELAGVIWKRAVVAPADAKAWLRAVIGGLTARGVIAQFDAPATVNAQFSLQTAWITDSADNFNANVVLHLRAQVQGSERSIDQTYRGRAVRTAYWSGGVDTMQSAVDGAFADALNRMAPDLKVLCEKSDRR